MNTVALIFDLDGTVLDNEKQWGKAFANVLEDLGAEDVKAYPHTPGIGVKENWPGLLEEYDVKTKLSYRELENLTRKEFDKFSDEVAVQEGFEEFVRSAREMGYLTALATSNIWMTVEKVFDQFDIQNYFDVITTGEEVDEKKPNPSIFLVTSQKLGVNPDECVVFEDAPSGVEAAMSARMSVVGIARNNKSKKLLKGADIVISDFSEISIDEIKQENK